MIATLLIPLSACLLWIGTLWLGFRPELAQWSLTKIAAVHLLPPLILSFVWLGLRRRARLAKEEAAAQREAEQAAVRKAAMDKARKQHEEEMRQRRFGCDCRAIALHVMTGADPHAQQPDIPLPGGEVTHIHLRVGPAEDGTDDEAQDLLTHLEAALYEVLESLYLSTPAAAVLPLYVQLPAELAAEEVMTMLRRLHATLATSLDLPLSAQKTTPPVLVFPSADTAADGAIRLFESDPPLPGAIVLAFDSPLYRQQAAGSDDFSGFSGTSSSTGQAKPAQAICGLLLTHPELEIMLQTLPPPPEESEIHESLKPFWERPQSLASPLGMLAHLPEATRAELLAMPKLGRVHRAAVRSAESASGVLALTRSMQAAFEQAQIHAGLIDLPFSQDASQTSDSAEADPSAAKEESAAPTACARLVHDAGITNTAGRRLAALGSAMFHFQIDFSPVDPAISLNLPNRIGETGAAQSLTQLALAIASAAEAQASTINAHYFEDERIAVSIVAAAAAA